MGKAVNKKTKTHGRLSPFIADISECETFLFYEPYSHRYFETGMVDAILAMYHLNRNYILRGYASLNELYSFLGIEEVKGCDKIGWSMGLGAQMGYQWIDIWHVKIEMDDGLECYHLSFPFPPGFLV